MNLIGNKNITQSATPDFSSIFSNRFQAASQIQIAVGYISVEAVQWLIESIESAIINENPISLELIVGMHYFEGISRGQYKALSILDNLLRKHSIGGIHVVNRILFHGKCYLFSQPENLFAGFVGSSNLSAIVDSESILEVDVEVTDINLLEKIHKTIVNLRDTYSIPFEKWVSPRFLKNTPKLQNVPGITTVERDELANILSQKTGIEFEIPIKTVEDRAGRSNLNSHFGQGRRDLRGQFRRRPWYEAEIIVSNTITSNPEYPKGTFQVVTTDGWQFECKTQGDYNKNLRSTGSLSILGMWIKGKMEDNGVLQLGEEVKRQTLVDYGRKTLTLSQTRRPNFWVMDFEP